jgi:hypothetical protein
MLKIIIVLLLIFLFSIVKYLCFNNIILDKSIIFSQKVLSKTMLLKNEFKSSLSNSSLVNDVFENIYKSNGWGPYARGSGPGSTLEYTSNMRNQLLNFLINHNVQTIMDSSCGSMYWMPHVLESYAKINPGFHFLGLDVTCSLIAQHKLMFQNNTNWSFQCLDYTQDPLPLGYDVIISRDSLQHLPIKYAFEFLSNVKSSKAKYLMIGSYLEDPNVNADVPVGGYYSIDVTRAPFNVSPKPYMIFKENPDSVQKFLLVWKIQDMNWTTSTF